MNTNRRGFLGKLMAAPAVLAAACRARPAEPETNIATGECHVYDREGEVIGYAYYGPGTNGKWNKFGNTETFTT